MTKANSKIIVILGPTASGKSDLAIKLAKKFDGEIISADSRQIYRGMDLGTGKIAKAEQRLVKHHMLDIISPKTNFSVAQFKKKAEKIIEDILKRNKLPIICGGTGFWTSAVVDNKTFPEVKPNFKLREKLGKLSTENLYKKLQKLDLERAKNIDAKNKVRLIRAIEICKELGSVPNTKYNILDIKYQFLQIGIDIPKEKLHKNIKLRLEKRWRSGMIKEVERLHKDGVSWKRLEMFGLEYRYISQFLQNKISKTEMKEKLFQESKNYAKRQMTWFKKDKRINWIRINSAGDLDKALEIIIKYVLKGKIEARN